MTEKVTKKQAKAAKKQELRYRLKNKDLKISVTCSYGVTSVYQEDNLNILLDRVDSLMYDAKDAGRDKIVSWREG